MEVANRKISIIFIVFFALIFECISYTCIFDTKHKTTFHLLQLEVLSTVCSDLKDYDESERGTFGLCTFRMFDIDEHGYISFFLDGPKTDVSKLSEKS